MEVIIAFEFFLFVSITIALPLGFISTINHVFKRTLISFNRDKVVGKVGVEPTCACERLNGPLSPMEVIIAFNFLVLNTNDLSS